jgi:hypothetical protein
MKKGKKAPKRRTALDRITAEIHVVLRRATKDAITAGKLLTESRKLLGHGEWQNWLADNFDLSYRTAINYCQAAGYVARKAKSETVADFSALAPTVLYALAAGGYNAKEEAAILAATRKGRVGQTRVSEVCDALTPPDSEPDPPDADAEPVRLAIAEDPEITAILDGPPPEVPAPAPNTAQDFTLRAFDQAVDALKQLMTKPAARFACSVHASDLQAVESFLRAVADRAREASARTESGNGYSGRPTETTR